jgi:hypothetical protein
MMGTVRKEVPAMSRLVVDAHMRERLERVTEAVDLVDETGRKLGRFTPEPICPWDPALTKGEIDRLIRESKGSTLADIKNRHGMA